MHAGAGSMAEPQTQMDDDARLMIALQSNNKK
jgi:hypothetical protein